MYTFYLCLLIVLHSHTYINPCTYKNKKLAFCVLFCMFKYYWLVVKHPSLFGTNQTTFFSCQHLLFFYDFFFKQQGAVPPLLLPLNSYLWCYFKIVIRTMKVISALTHSVWEVEGAGSAVTRMGTRCCRSGCGWDALLLLLLLLLHGTVWTWSREIILTGHPFTHRSTFWKELCQLKDS